MGFYSPRLPPSLPVSPDHTSGLSSSWSEPIHCTPVTAKLLRRKFNIDPRLMVSCDPSLTGVIPD